MSPLRCPPLTTGGSRMGEIFNDSLIILGFLAIVLAPMALALAEPGPGGAGWKLLAFVCCALAAWVFFRLKSTHRICDVGLSVGMRDGHANKQLQSTPCVIRESQRTSPSCRSYAPVLNGPGCVALADPSRPRQCFPHRNWLASFAQNCDGHHI